MTKADSGGLIIGVDEVGRGCLAGPIYGCAYVFLLPPSKIPHGIILRDSKKMSVKQRGETYAWLHSIPHVKAVVSKTPQDIDTIGIQKANLLVLEESLQGLVSSLSPSQRQQCRAIIDGRIRVGTTSIETECVIQGDDLYPCVSAASIIAKVERDRYMEQLGATYQEYFWERNKGYGTLAHREAIQTHGVTQHHRMTFLTKL